MSCHPACECLQFPLRPVDAQSLATCWIPATTSVLEIWFTTRTRQEVPGLLLLPLLLTGSYEGRCVYLEPGPELTCSVPERLNPSTRAPGCPWCRTEVQRKVINGGSLISLAHAASQSSRVKKPEMISVNRATELLQVTTPRGRISLAAWFAKEANRWMSSRVLPRTFIRHVLKLMHACRMECHNLRCDHRRPDHVLARKQGSRTMISQSSQPLLWTLQKKNRGWECILTPAAVLPRPTPAAPPAEVPASSGTPPAPVRATPTAPPPVRATPTAPPPARTTQTAPPPARVPAPAPAPEPKPQPFQNVPAQQPPLTENPAPVPPKRALVRPRLNPKAGARKVKKKTKAQEPPCITLDKSQ